MATDINYRKHRKPIRRGGIGLATSRKYRGRTRSRLPRAFSKKAIVRDMLIRAGGATLQEIVDATAWQNHTVRGFISTLTKKTGIAITSTRREGDQARVYEAAK